MGARAGAGAGGARARARADPSSAFARHCPDKPGRAVAIAVRSATTNTVVDAIAPADAATKTAGHALAEPFTKSFSEGFTTAPNATYIISRIPFPNFFLPLWGMGLHLLHCFFTSVQMKMTIQHTASIPSSVVCLFISISSSISFPSL